MRKLLLALFFVGTTTTIFAQEDELNITLSGGVPMGKVKDVSKMAFAGDVNYLFQVSDHIKIGPSVSCVYFNAKNKDVKSLMFLPLGFSTKFMSSNERFFVGTDLGYGLPLGKDNKKGGVYFKPYLGYSISDVIKVSVSYTGIPFYSGEDAGANWEKLGGKDVKIAPQDEKNYNSGYIGLNLTFNLL